MADSVETEKTELATSSDGTQQTENADNLDASRDSSPALGEQHEDSPPPGGESEPLAKTPAQERLEKLLNGETPAEDDSPSSEATAAEGEPGSDGAPADEPNASQAKPKAADVLSQEQEQVFSKAFSERPEWREAISIARKAGPDAEKSMRKQLRTIFQRETALAGQVEALKPAAQIADRIKRCTGDEAGLENSLRLIEGWFEGRPEAEQMLEELLSDLRTRTGKVIHSPDLKQRWDSAQSEFNDGTLDETQLQQIKRDLLEIEGARAGKKTVESRLQAKQQGEAEQRQQTIIAERTTALNDWERNIGRRDPDYPRIAKLVADRAARLAEARHAEAKRMLSAKEMVAICDEAYQTVKTELGGLLPKPRAKSPPPEIDGSSEVSEKEPADPVQAMIWRQKRGRR